MKEDYKIDFTGVDWSYDGILERLFKHLTKEINNYNYSKLSIYDNSYTCTGKYITYYNLHNRFPQFKEIQEMILQYHKDKDMALLGAIMLRKLIEK